MPETVHNCKLRLHPRQLPLLYARTSSARCACGRVPATGDRGAALTLTSY